MTDAAKQLGEDVISLICAREAFMLRKDIARVLWEDMESRGVTTPQCLSFLDPLALRDGGLNVLIAEDVKTLRACWHALNNTQQTEEKKHWVGLQPDSSETDFSESVLLKIRRHFYDTRLENLAASVLRYSAMLDNLDKFWKAHRVYIEQGRAIAQRREMLERWTDLFSVLVAPVTGIGNARRLHTTFPPATYTGFHNLYATTDKQAYAFFQQYVAKELSSVVCAEYRDALNGGIRSLNCCCFNHLWDLKSCGDHPAALLLGCRSGVQYQVLSHADKSPCIRAMVAVYFPLYGFFERLFAVTDGVTRSLMAKTTSQETDESYAEFWFNPPTPRSEISAERRLASLLIQPFKDNLGGINPMVRRLDCLSRDYPKICTYEIASGFPHSVKNAITTMKGQEFDPDSAGALTEWLDLYCAQQTSEHHTEPSQSIQLSPQQYFEKMIDASNKLWQRKVNSEIEESESRFNGVAALENVRKCLITDLWEQLLAEICAKPTDHAEFKIPSVYVMPGGDFVTVKFELFIYHGLLAFSSDGQLIEEQGFYETSEVKNTASVDSQG